MVGKPEIITIYTVDPCSGITCQPHAQCVVEEDGVTSCVCDECPQDDLESWDPLCGSDCETYNSQCDMDRAVCQSGFNVSVAFRGSCASAGI